MSDLYKVRITGHFEGTREQVVKRCLMRGNLLPDLEWHLRAEDAPFVELQLLVIDVHPDAGIWFDAMHVFRLVADGLFGRDQENTLYVPYGGWRGTNNIWFEPRPDGRNPVWLSRTEYVEIPDLPRDLRAKFEKDDPSPTPVLYTVVLPKKFAPTLELGKTWSSTAYPGEDQPSYMPHDAPSFPAEYVERGFRALAFTGTGIYAAPDKGSLLFWELNKLRPKREKTPCEGSITELAVDGRGALWAFDNRMVIARRDTQGQWQAVRNRGLASTRLGRTLGPVAVSPRTGRVWVATPKGLLELESPLQWRAVPTLKPIAEVPEGPHTTVQTMAFHPDGSLWVGLLGGGVERIDERSHEPVSFKKDRQLPVPEPWLSRMRFARDGTLWASLFNLKGQVFTRSPEGRWSREPKAPRFPSQLLETSKGDLWMGNMGGLFRRNAQGKWSRFRANDGKGLLSSNIMSIQDDAEGRLWAGTNEGVYRQAGLNEWERMAPSVRGATRK
jgi:hypothetical protein